MRFSARLIATTVMVIRFWHGKIFGPVYPKQLRNARREVSGPENGHSEKEMETC